MKYVKIERKPKAVNKEQLIQFIKEHYNSTEDHPWTKYPSYTVFRHINNKKWFALIMDLTKSKLGIDEDEIIDVVNVKCDPNLIGSLRQEKGFYPAYHMNKTNWITIALDGSVEAEKIKWLLDMSYELTADTKKELSISRQPLS